MEEFKEEDVEATLTFRLPVMPPPDGYRWSVSEWNHDTNEVTISITNSIQNTEDQSET